jgi:hypothetical protein
MMGAMAAHSSNAIRPHDVTGPPITLKGDVLTEHRILRQRSKGKPPSGVRDLAGSTLHGVHTQLDLSKELAKGADFGETMTVVRCIQKNVCVLERQNAENEPDMPVVIKDTPRRLEIGLEVMKVR